MHTLTCTRETQKASLTNKRILQATNPCCQTMLPWHHRKTALSLDRSPLLHDPNTMLKGLGPSVPCLLLHLAHGLCPRRLHLGRGLCVGAVAQLPASASRLHQVVAGLEEACQLGGDLQGRGRGGKGGWRGGAQYEHNGSRMSQGSKRPASLGVGGWKGTVEGARYTM